MRLLNLVAVGLAGYALYELGRGVLSWRGQRPDAGGAGEHRSAAQRADVRRQVLSGGSGEGMAVDVHDPSGATRRQVVGRGVVQR